MFGGIPLQATFQRVLSARSSHYAQKILLIASFGLLLMVIPAFILGAVAKSTGIQAFIPLCYIVRQ